MKTSPLRFVLALVLGVFVAYCVNIFFQSYAPKLMGYAVLEEGLTREAYINYLQNLPSKGTLALIVSCALGAFSGGYVAARVSSLRKKDAALAVGAFSVIILVFMAIAFSFPLFLAIGIVFVQIPFAFLGGKVAAYR